MGLVWRKGPDAWPCCGKLQVRGRKAFGECETRQPGLQLQMVKPRRA